MRTSIILPTLLGLLTMCAGTPLASAAASSTSTAPPPTHHLHRRDDLPESTKQFRSGIRTKTEGRQEMDLIQWATDATTECLKLFSGNKQASNDAGVAVCYNIPAVFTDQVQVQDENPIHFAIDFRLFQLNEAKGDWANIDGGYVFDVKFNTTTTAAQMRNITAVEMAASFAATVPESSATLITSYPFLGRFNESFARSNPTE